MQDQVLSDKLSSLKEKIEGELKELKNSKELYEFKNVYLEGKKSKISELMKDMGKLAPEERAGYGKSVNELKTWAFDKFADMEEKMKKLELQHKYEREKIDLTIPAEPVKIGNLHPVTLVRNQLIDIFAGMGFEIYEGSEIETDYYNFTALNTPQDHPARDMRAIPSYLSPEFLLPRTRDLCLDRFMLWRRSSRRLRFYLPVRNSVPMMMPPILQCSPRWRVWL